MLFIIVLIGLFQSNSPIALQAQAIDFLVNGNYIPLKPIDLNFPRSAGNSPLEESIKETKLNIFPNPFKDHLTFESANFDISSIEIFDALGKMIFTKSFKEGQQSFMWKVGQQSAGLYFYKVQFSDNSMNEGKVVLQK